MPRELPDRPIFVLKIKSLRGDGIHELRALLKRLRRPHQWRCISIERAPANPIKSSSQIGAA
jgi:hypothetical protein